MVMLDERYVLETALSLLSHRNRRVRDMVRWTVAQRLQQHPNALDDTGERLLGLCEDLVVGDPDHGET